MDIIQKTPDTDEIIFDRKGANGQVRVAVNVKDTVLLANIFDRAKSFQAREKDVKDLSEEAIMQRKKQLLVDHDRHCDYDAKALAAGMVKASGEGTAGNSFASNTYEVDVESLAVKVEAEDADNQEDDSKDAVKEEKDEETPIEPAPKKRGFWDRDTAVASKMRQESNALVTLNMQVDTKLHEGRTQLNEVTKRGPDCARETSVERETLTRRLKFLEAVLQPNAQALEQCKNGVASASGPPQVSSQPAGPNGKEASPSKGGDGSTETAWVDEIGTAPPCF